MVIIAEDYSMAVLLTNKNSVRAEILFDGGMYDVNHIFLKGLMELNYHVNEFLVKNNYQDLGVDVYVMDMVEDEVVIKHIVSLTDLLSPIISEGEEVWV